MKRSKRSETNIKNKAFLIFSLLLGAIIFGSAILINRSNLTEDSDLANPINLIREHSFSKGAVNAPVTIVEFFDPECEACRTVHAFLNRLCDEFRGQLRIVYRYTTFHKNSQYASAVLEEAKENGKFVEALDVIFAKQPIWAHHRNPRPALLATYMEELGLEKTLFDYDRVIKKHRPKIEIDRQDGRQLLVKHTPTMFVNGRRLQNIGYVFIKSAIEQSLLIH